MSSIFSHLHTLIQQLERVFVLVNELNFREDQTPLGLGYFSIKHLPSDPKAIVQPDDSENKLKHELCYSCPSAGRQ